MMVAVLFVPFVSVRMLRMLIISRVVPMLRRMRSPLVGRWIVMVPFVLLVVWMRWCPLFRWMVMRRMLVVSRVIVR